MADIEKQIKSLAEKGRDGKLTVEDLTGGNFTITNGGVFGSFNVYTNYQSTTKCNFRYACHQKNARLR